MRWLMVIACAALPTGALAQSPAPSLLVFPLEAKDNVEPSTADVVTETLVATIRKAGVFAKVTHLRELDTLMGLERQKQVVNCASDSCVAEIAGSLGADYLLTGSLARLGGSYVFNAKVLDVKRATAVASALHRSRGTSDEALLDAVPLVVDELLRTFRAPAAPPVANAKSAESSSGIHPLPVVGLVLLGVSVPVALLAVVLGGSAVASQIVPRVIPVPSKGLTWEQRLAGIYGTTVVLAVASGAMAVVAALVLAGGGGATVVGLTQ